MNLTEAKDIAVGQHEESYNALLKGLADKAHNNQPITPEELEFVRVIRNKTVTNVEKATKNLMIAKSRAVLPTVSKWANVGYAALTGVGTAGAGFGYHYLSNFILEDLPSILHGRKF